MTNRTEYNRQWRAENRERMREYQRKYVKKKGRSYITNIENKARKKYMLDPEKRAKHMLGVLRRRRRVQDKGFGLSKEWMTDKLKKGVCEVTGLPLDLSTPRGPLSPSVDRIDSSLGYTEDNCQVVVFMYNLAKSNWTHDDVLVMANALAN